jgi:glycosyltransferase involved in cell wall biosynthesis
MDDFAWLRHELYLSYAPGDARADRALAQALAGGDTGDDPTLEAMIELRAAVMEPGSRASSAALAQVRRLGDSPYVDRYLADALRGREGADEALRERAEAPGGRRASYACAGAAGLQPFDAQMTARAFASAASAEERIDILGYAASAGLVELIPSIRGLLKEGDDWAVAAAARAALKDLGADSEALRPPDAAPFAPLAQTLFYGDPGRPGKGSGGGVGTLVKELGAALGALGLPILSLVAYDSLTRGYPFSESEVGGGVTVRRMPIYLGAEGPAAFALAAHRIGPAVRRALAWAPVRPRALHVRFIDDASRAAALAARSLGIELALTLTPDPHRSVCGPDGHIRPRRGPELHALLNRIWIGDELLSWARGVMAIGRDSFATSLIPYYPQLEDRRDKVYAGVDEGVKVSPAAPYDRLPVLLSRGEAGTGIDPARFNRPALVCVGRLNPAKGQANLARAWAVGGLWRRYNLVMIGGDYEQPSPEESSVVGQIREAVGSESASSLCLLPAQPNEAVRSLLSWFSSREPEGGPDFYVCPSLKEEFGLSILEAMAEGLPAIAPLAGGAPSYIRHGVNGFLADTRDAPTLGRELKAILGEYGGQLGRVEAIRAAARRTVVERYSLESMAGEYLRFYKSMA